MGGLLCLVKCGFGPRGCGMPCIGPVRESSTTRLMYSLILIFGAAILTVSHENKALIWASQKLNWTYNETCLYIQADSNCQRLSGFKAVYRIAFPFSIFHLLMAIFCICISNANGWRARIHNGFWFFKFLFITVLWFMLYMIPIFDKATFIATIIGVTAAIIFIIIQQVSVIDCAYEFNDYLRQKSSENCCFTFLLYIITMLLYTCTVGAYILIIFQFAIPKYCQPIRIVIAINATATLILVIFSFFVNKHKKFKLFIPGAVTSLFVAFLTWTAISSAPNINMFSTYVVNSSRQVPTFDSCHPQSQFLKSHFGKELHAYLGIVIMLLTAVYSSIKSTVDYKRYGIKPAQSKMFSMPQLNTIQEDVEMEDLQRKSKHRISGSYLSTPSGDKLNNTQKSMSLPNVNIVENSSKSKKSKVNNNALRKQISSNSISSKSKIIRKPSRSNSKLDKKISIDNLIISQDMAPNIISSQLRIDNYLIHDEYDVVRYSYTWMHVVFGLAFLFVMVQLTNWYSPETSHILKFSETLPSFWMKIVTSWVALGLYFWSLICPAFCIGRKLYEFPLDSMSRYRDKVVKEKR